MVCRMTHPLGLFPVYCSLLSVRAASSSSSSLPSRLRIYYLCLCQNNCFFISFILSLFFLLVTLFCLRLFCYHSFQPEFTLMDFLKAYKRKRKGKRMWLVHKLVIKRYIKRLLYILFTFNLVSFYIKTCLCVICLS